MVHHPTRVLNISILNQGRSQEFKINKARLCIYKLIRQNYIYILKNKIKIQNITYK